MFDEILFPADIASRSVGGPAFKTIITITGAGAEQRQGTQGRARLTWDVAPGITSNEELDEVIAFFRARRGRLRGFLWKDWVDYQSSLEALSNPYPLGAMQLTKTYTSGGESEVRNILKPLESSVVLQRNTGAGWEVWGSGWTLDDTTGVVTIASPTAGHEYRWSGEFYVPVRFDRDNLSINLEEGVPALDNLPIIEVLL